MRNIFPKSTHPVPRTEIARAIDRPLDRLGEDGGDTTIVYSLLDKQRTLERQLVFLCKQPFAPQLRFILC